MFRVKEMLMSPPLAERLRELRWVRRDGDEYMRTGPPGGFEAYDRAMRLLHLAPNLERLTFHNIYVSDVDLCSIATHPALRVVGLHGTLVTRAAADRLQEGMPNTVITYSEEATFSNR